MTAADFLDTESEESSPDYDRIFADAEKKYALQPGLLGAIAKQENVNPAYNNPLGLSDDSGVHRFTPDEAEARIMGQARLITNPNGPYRDFARSRDIGDLAKVWAPVGASNDINQTNDTEEAGIRANLPQNLSFGLVDQTEKQSAEDFLNDSKPSAEEFLGVSKPAPKPLWEQAKEYVGGFFKGAHIATNEEYAQRLGPLMPTGPGLTEPLYKPEKVHAGDEIPDVDPSNGQPNGHKHVAGSFEAAAWNTARGFISGVSSVKGLVETLPPVFFAEAIYNSPDVWKKIQEADNTPAWSQERWETGLGVVGTLATAGLMGHALVKGLTASAPIEVAKKMGGESDAIKRSDAQVQARETPQREQARPESEKPIPSDSDNVVREAEGRESGGIPQETAEVRGEQEGLTPQLRPGEQATGELFQGEDQPFNLAGEEGTDFEARQRAADQAEADRGESEKAQNIIQFEDLTEAEKERIKREYEADLLSDVEDHQARGGDELMDVIKQYGLPAVNSKFSKLYQGELENLRGMFSQKSGFSKAISGENIKYADVFRKDAQGGVEGLTQHLQSKGFNVYTPGDTVDLIEHRLRTGQRVYGVESLNESLEAQSYSQGDLMQMGATTPTLARKLMNAIRLGADVISGMTGQSGKGSLDGMRLNPENGGKKPPPPNSIFGPDTPPDSDPVPYYAARVDNVFKRWWEKFWPRDYSIVKLDEKLKVKGSEASPVISDVERFLADYKDSAFKYSESPWWKAFRGRSNDEVIELEDRAVKRYRNLLNTPKNLTLEERGASMKRAMEGALKGLPDWFTGILKYRESQVPLENEAADILGVDRPNHTSDPYIARLTNEEGKNIVEVHPRIGNLGRQVRTTIGSFENSRTKLTMKDGINDGVQYEDAARSVWMRELYSKLLIGTGKLIKGLKDKGVLFDSKVDAWKHSPTGRIMEIRGISPKSFWSRSVEEGIFLEQQLAGAGRDTAMSKIHMLANNWFRNPQLFNPLPHVTKNMFFKYLLARPGGWTRIAGDWAEYAKGKGAMIDRFKKVMPFTDTAEQVSQLTAQEVGKWHERMLTKGSKANGPAAQFVFAKADPAMRYSLWKHYVSKGLSDQESANHTWVDLIRYNANSGGMTFWKNIPFNFFVPWRTGTYVSLIKQLRAHPIRSLLFLGAVEYLREVRYRHTGRWTHLPIDYMEGPLAEVVDVAHQRGGVKSAEFSAGLATTTAVFGPGGGQAVNTVKDIMSTLQQDPSQRARIMQMFYGLSQVYNMGREWNAYRKDGDYNHLANILMTASVSERDALKYEPYRFAKWLPEWMPGMQKSKMVHEAEALREKILKRQLKGEATYERRHGVSATFDVSPAGQQMDELRRAAGQRDSTKKTKDVEDFLK